MLLVHKRYLIIRIIREKYTMKDRFSIATDKTGEYNTVCVLGRDQDFLN